MAEQRFQAAQHFLYYTDLHYISEEQKKDPLWAAACLMFSKFNNKPLVKPERVKLYRDIDEGIINKEEFQKLFDPPDPTDSESGMAKYVATDWQSNPIFVHINNIVDTSIEKIPVNLYCKAIDEYAMVKQQKENMKILGKREFMKFLNEMNQKLGYPKLKSTDDPFRYAEQMGQKPPTNGSKKNTGVTDTPTGLIDSIKAMIDDNEDLALFNEFIYKGDVEIAIELGQKHYFKINKWERIGEKFIVDIRHHNRACGRWYTSQTTGKPVMEHFDPDKVYVAPFKDADGRDMQSWFIEYNITFGDFVRMFGRGLSEEQLQSVFEKNKQQGIGAGHGLDWNRCSISQRHAANIRIGYHEWQSQDCKVFAEGQRNGNMRFKPKPYEWQPKKNVPKEYKDVRTERHYNVWYKCYYLPIANFGDLNAVKVGDFIGQADYIFDFGKLQDQQRYGDDDRECKSSLVVWKRPGMSFAEIMNRYMPKIHFLWQKYQHNIAQTDVYAVMSNELVEGMMKIADDTSKESKPANKMEWLKMIAQTGRGFADMKDKNGHRIDVMAMFTAGYGKAAMENLEQIRLLYGEMTTALAISDVREGIDPKPRTSLGGIQLSLQASNNGTYFLEKGYMDMTLEFANRMLYYMNQIVEEGDSKRMEEFANIVGLANSMAYEAIKDIPKHQLGYYIENINTDKQKEQLVQFAQELVKAGLMDVEALQLIIKIDNYKYAAVLMIMKYKQKQKQIQQQKQLEFQQMMMAKEKDLQIATATFQAKEQAKLPGIDLEKKWDMAIEKMVVEMKSQSKAMLDEMKNNNKQQQDVNRHNLEKQDTVAA